MVNFKRLNNYMDNEKLRVEYIKKAKQGYFDKFVDGRGEIDEEKSADYWLNILSLREQELWDKIEGMKKDPEKYKRPIIEKIMEIKSSKEPTSKRRTALNKTMSKLDLRTKPYNKALSDIQSLLKVSKEK